MADPVKIQAIRDELINDPAGIGYTATSVYSTEPDLTVKEGYAVTDTALFMAVNRSTDVETLSASELFEAVDATEWSARTADQKDNIRLVLGLGDNIKIAPGTKARAILADALSGATNSLANLSVLGSKTVSRAEELGLGRVTVGDIQNARNLV